MSQCELGIEPVFWAELADPVMVPAVEPVTTVPKVAEEKPAPAPVYPTYSF